MNPEIERITRRIRERSATHRDRYLALMAQMRRKGPQRDAMSCTNLAHVTASKPDSDKMILRQTEQNANIGIVSAYNEILSAHQPYGGYPDQIRRAVARQGMSPSSQPGCRPCATGLPRASRAWNSPFSPGTSSPRPRP